LSDEAVNALKKNADVTEKNVLAEDHPNACAISAN